MYSRDVIFQPKGQGFIEVKDCVKMLPSFLQWGSGFFQPIFLTWDLAQYKWHQCLVFLSFQYGLHYFLITAKHFACGVCLFVFNQRQKNVCLEDRLIHSNILRLKELLFALSALYISFLYYSCVCLVWCYFCQGLFCPFFFF